MFMQLSIIIWYNSTVVLSNSTVVLFSRDPPESDASLKLPLIENHPTNILHEEKHAHGIVLALPKPNKAFKTTK